MFGISNEMRDTGIAFSREYPGGRGEVKEFTIARIERPSGRWQHPRHA
jgi:hypothetical protein